MTRWFTWEGNKQKTICREHTLVYVSSCQICKLLIWMAWKPESLCQTLLNNCLVKTQTFLTFKLSYLTLLLYLRHWFWIEIPNPKNEAGSLSKHEHQKVQCFYTQGGAASGSLKNIVEASRLAVSKTRQFFLSKPSHTKITFAARNFEKINKIVWFKTEKLCIFSIGW